MNEDRLLHSLFQGTDQLVPLGLDIVFHVEDALPLTPLLALQTLGFFLEIVLP